MDATEIFDLIKQAYENGALTQGVVGLLTFLKVPVKAALQETVKEKITGFFSRNNDKSTLDDLMKELREVKELERVTSQDMTNAFNATFNGDASGCIMAGTADRSMIFNNCNVKIIQEQREMGKHIEAVARKLGKTPDDIKELPSLASSINKAITEGYNLDEKKEHIKKLIEERIEKSCDDNIDMIEIRKYDNAIEIISQLTLQELNLLALCFLGYLARLSENTTRENSVKTVAGLCQNFKNIGNINSPDVFNTFNKSGLGFTLISSSPAFLNIFANRTDSMFFEDLLKEPNMLFLVPYKEMFQKYGLAFSNNNAFRLVGYMHCGKVMGADIKITG